jgi:hypothetical protein
MTSSVEAEKKQRKIKQTAKGLRVFRKVHRVTGALLFFIFIAIALSGLLLGWKKNSNGLIIPDTQKGISTNQADWLPLHLLTEKAFQAFTDSIHTIKQPELDRVDVRPSKGIMKFRFENDLWEVQLDATTGKVLSVGKRYSDLLENLHDGSFVDDALGLPAGIFKLLYTSISGIALLLFSITGFWLWYGPKYVRKLKR